MMTFIDNQLNRITMYRLVLYYLILVFGVAFVMSSATLVNLDPFALLFSLGLLIAVCWVTNRIFSIVYGVPANVESVYISALILSLIIAPPQTTNDYWFLLWAAVLSMASKYIVAYKAKHIFNPVGLALVIIYFATNQSADWWIGNAVMFPIIFLGGLLIVRKIGKSDLVLSFLTSIFFFVLLSAVFIGNGILTTLLNTILYSPLLFFAFIILTEPLTTPPTKKLRIIYGALLGFLFTPQLHFGSFFITPEIAIVIGNIYSFIVSPKIRLTLRLKEKTRIAPDTYEFSFSLPKRITFKPGQYMEWTLGHRDPDSRGNRRYFTLASSPSENILRLGVKFSENSSNFKKRMLSMGAGSEIIAAQLEGDFVLPDDSRKKCVFIAGGIGITPFRSMIKYLLDKRQSRPITIFYAVRSPEDMVYKDILDRAERELGIKTIYSISNNQNLSSTDSGVVKRIDGEVIRKTVPNYQACLYYISGSREMVEGFKSVLQRIGISDVQIKTDFFAGLA